MENCKADLILKNGLIHTVDVNKTIVEAVAIKDGSIVSTGKTSEIESYLSPQTKVIDLKGKLVLPSFGDSHMHPSQSAYIYQYQLSLHNMFKHEEYIEAIKAFSESHPDLPGIYGAGFQRSAYDKIGPRKEVLDTIDSTRPIAICSTDGHSLWVNSKALEMAGITKGTPAPAGGTFQLDPETGEPAGLLQEHAAMELVESIFPSGSKEDMKKSLLWLQKWLNEKGITFVHDAWINLDAKNIHEAYQELDREGLLTIRVRGSWFIEPKDGFLDRIAEGIELSQQVNGDNFQVNSFKFFVDQVIEEETAALLEPYTHRPDFYGQLDWSLENLISAYAKVDRANFQIHTHAIGDAGVKQSVDALLEVRRINGKRDARPSLAHVQLAQAEDIKKMADLDVSAHISPYWMVVDDYFWDLYYPYLGSERAHHKQYPHKSLFDAGVNVTCASDFFVTEPDIGWVLFSGVTRTLPKRIFDEKYNHLPDYEYVSDPSVTLSKYQVGMLGPKEECVSVENMVDELTINIAYANFLEKITGSLEIGKKADLVVLDRNLYQIDIEALANPKILLTLFEGKTVFQAEDF